jgi:16S rRNA (guanine527-N7)-methyltransferase
VEHRNSAADAERTELARGIDALSLEVAPGAVDALLAYATELRKWNRQYNLVSAADMEVLVARHLLDSLAILPWVGNGRLLDVGTGAGLPGLVLAIASPGLRCSVLDSAGKKTRFLRHVVRRLSLDYVDVINDRVENVRDADGFDIITSRAFASLAEFVGAVRHLAAPDARLLAMKGRRPDKELAELPGGVEVTAVTPLTIPGLHAERHLCIMSLSPGRST